MTRIKSSSKVSFILDEKLRLKQNSDRWYYDASKYAFHNLTDNIRETMEKQQELNRLPKSVEIKDALRHEQFKTTLTNKILGKYERLDPFAEDVRKSLEIKRAMQELETKQRELETNQNKELLNGMNIEIKY